MTKPRVPRAVLRDLERLRDVATYENASFGDIKWQTGNCTKTTDEICKEGTRLHRETWILPVLDRLLKWGNGL